MKRLTIDWCALELAFDDAADEFQMRRSHFLDVQSGEVVCVDEQTGGAVDSVVAELDESFDEAVALTDQMVRETQAFQALSEEEQASVLATIKIDYGDSDQFEQVPHFDSHQSYEWMSEFIETLAHDELRKRLRDAISRRRPFRRFRDMLEGDQRLERQWLEFEAARQREAIMEWLESIGVEPANPAVSIYNPPPLPDLRNIMFSEVRRFVRFARNIEGVRRIALIGSLATDKEFPKDIDLLVTISEACDLGPLAKLARQLRGHLNSEQAGADVFLASEDGDYLGRICLWRDCGPGLHASCDALHCGRRPFLHDDFDSVRLKKNLLADPPVRLWPTPAAKQEVAADVHQHLIQQLTKDDVN